VQTSLQGILLSFSGEERTQRKVEGTERISHRDTETQRYRRAQNSKLRVES
jgi:hypothetical protein